MIDDFNNNICLKVGVTAHRDLNYTDTGNVQQQVREFLQRLRSQFPSLPIVLVNPLAEGGDMLVAKVALDMGIRLEAPLPMPAELYEQDFEPAVLAEFRSTLARCDSYELPLAPGNTLDNIRDHGEARNRQYAQLGMYIASHTHMLLALWDGRESAEPGGTASVVHYQLQDVMPGLPSLEQARNLLAEKENDLVYHIHCPRDDSEQQRVGRWLSSNSAYPGLDMPRRYRAAFEHMVVFKRDANRHAALIQSSGDSLLTHEAMREQPDLSAIDSVYRVADRLAILYRQLVVRELVLTHALAALMGFSFLTYSEYQELAFLLPAFLACFFTAWCVNKLANWLSWHRKYLDYRALAEGLRVQFYWCLADVEDFHGTAFTYDNLMQKQDVELVWIRHMMRSVSTAGRANTCKLEQGLALAIEHWVGGAWANAGQLAYYHDAGQARANKLKRDALFGQLTLWAGISTALYLLFMAAELGEHSTNVLFIMMGLLPLLAGIREAYAYKKADKELTKQYLFMFRTFSVASEKLEQSQDRETRCAILKALGETCLEEHAEWILLHRERPLETSGLAA
ncbi:hypothetical protein DWB85_17865 [Seongchinamella sediminis]|uniref:SMODS and SLOG-associating 2TM effector domain-containing protein n=1 Tax=Seongchinamella sediminis TaxID=2283635 RepID=A0A3L7DST6_9GAMM|nr:hypothetical protein [Seongchinamella sediminis]RLQ20414.1 hypothetical protein DWB85_17865 [Seongchinamella sediminis]